LGQHGRRGGGQCQGSGSKRDEASTDHGASLSIRIDLFII
jgi:hypothetical protein